MKVFSLVAALAFVALSSPLALAENILIATPAAANTTNSSEPMFLPGVGTPAGLDSKAGSAGKDDASSPLTTVKTADTGSMDGATNKTVAKPTGTKNASATPAPTPKSTASVALIGASVAATATALSLALL